MNGIPWCIVTTALLVGGAGCNCCKKPQTPTPASPATRPETPPRILGLDEGWELAPGGSTFAASQARGEVTITAAGEHPTGGYETRLVMSPLRIYPPQWMLAVKKPAGPVTQAITPFEVTASFKAAEPIEAVHVSDAAGKHRVNVASAND